MAGAYKKGRPDKKGRTTSKRKYVLIDADVFSSERFMSLSPAAVSLYVEFKHRFNGLNNGNLHMSVRDAAQALTTGVNQARQALKSLSDAGFIELCSRGGYRSGDASTWFLCEYPKGKPVMRRKSYKKGNVTMFADLIRSEEYRILKPRARMLFLYLLAGSTKSIRSDRAVIMSVTDIESALNCARATAHKALRSLEMAGLISPVYRGAMTTATAIGTCWLVAETSAEREDNRTKFRKAETSKKQNPRARIGYTPSANPQFPVLELDTPPSANPQFPMLELDTLIIPEGSDRYYIKGDADIMVGRCPPEKSAQIGFGKVDLAENE